MTSGSSKEKPLDPGVWSRSYTLNNDGRIEFWKFEDLTRTLIESIAGDHGMFRRTLAYSLLVGFVMIISLAGYGFYVWYPRFQLPIVYGLPLMVLAAGAGLASFFSPCSFPLLLVLFARGNGDTNESSPFTFALGLSVGASMFLLLLGASFAVGGLTVARQVTFGSTAGIALRSILGLVLIVLGFIQLGILSDRPFRWIESKVALSPEDEKRSLTFGRYVTFGFGYILAGFG